MKSTGTDCVFYCEKLDQIRVRTVFTYFDLPERTLHFVSIEGKTYRFVQVGVL